MKRLLSFFIILVIWTTQVLAHWNYNNLIINGKVAGDPYQYVRRTNNSNAPLQIVNSTDMRCNAGASLGTSLNTSTLTINAGDELGFVIESTFGHPGIQQVYLSRAPDGVNAADYDGSGDWARIYAVTTLANSTLGDEGLVWAMRRTHSFRFPLARNVPPGEYLLRAEGLALHAAHKLDCAQFYVGCAQVRVVGDGTGVPAPLVSIPGVYSDTTPGVLIPDFWTRITNYTEPGPELWPPGTQTQHVVKQLDS
ncbi:glycoside hydrolase [Truncatella angustata]|uniref:lytic cellulose monooxygenase (C4-dehydrogenating) n=1 Tax=Truncatella angustata TaxID=152316 RepID=A0A9P8UX51_9PEZI|nr:glycoside hydrolase [Truncatella angustata]KAH6659631.1 glycoside hydrolase [Truncatella angustata]